MSRRKAQVQEALALESQRPPGRRWQRPTSVAQPNSWERGCHEDGQGKRGAGHGCKKEVRESIIYMFMYYINFYLVPSILHTML